MKRLMLLNSSLGVIQVITSSVLYLISIPVFLRYLGDEQYGIFALITSIGTIGFFINFGFNLSVIKFVGDQGIGVESDRDIVLSFVIALTIVSGIAGIAILFNYQILRNILSVPNKFFNISTMYLFNFVVLSNALLFAGQIVTAVLDSQQKIYLSSYLQIGYSLATRLGTIVVLISGGNLFEVGVVILVSTILWFVSLLIIFFNTWKFTSWRGLFDGFRQRLNKLFSFGAKVYLTSVSGFFYEPFAKILIGRYIGMVEVGIFDIGFRIKTLLWSIIEKSLYPLLPFIAGKKNTSDSAEIIDWISRKMLLLSIPIIVCAFFLISPLINIWLTVNNAEVIFTSKVLLGGYLFTSAGLPMYIFLMVKGHIEKTFYIQALNALLSGVFFFVFVPYYGYVAAVFSFMASVLCTHVMLLYFQRKYLGSNIFTPMLLVLKSVFLAMLIAGVNAVVNANFTEPIQLIILYTIADTILLISFIKLFKIITANDLRRIVGKNISFQEIK